MHLIERTLLDMAAVALVLLCVVIFGDALLGAAGGAGIPGGAALARELMVATVALPLAAATAGRAHLVVSLVSDRLGLEGRARLILLGHAMGLLGLLPLIVAALQLLAELGQPGAAPPSLPAWPGLVLLIVGLAMMWLRLALMLVGDLREFRASGMITDEHGQEAF